jgi:hypothetical protein
MAEPNRDEGGGSRRNLIALIAILLLVLGGWLLARKLGAASRLQDCVMSGRTNCAPIEAPSQ